MPVQPRNGPSYNLLIPDADDLTHLYEWHESKTGVVSADSPLGEPCRLGFAGDRLDFVAVRPATADSRPR